MNLIDISKERFQEYKSTFNDLKETDLSESDTRGAGTPPRTLYGSCGVFTCICTFGRRLDTGRGGMHRIISCPHYNACLDKEVRKKSLG